MEAPRLRSFRPRCCCCGTAEDHLALDVRELYRRGVFDHRVGTVWRCGLQWPWLTTIKLDQFSLELRLRSGPNVIVLLAWARCGAIGNRRRLECPQCHRRVCKLYNLDVRINCRECARLWYKAQRLSAKGRKFLAIEKIRRKLGDYGPVLTDKPPPKPPRMWRRTYARHLASLGRIERSLYHPRR
jgi:hypothetical protein